MPVPIKNILPSFFKQTDDWRTVVLTHWQSLIGSLKTRVRLEKIQEDIIVVGVYEVHWMQELYLLTDVFKDSINEFLGKPHVRQVRFKLVEEKKGRRAQVVKKRTILVRGAVPLTLVQEKALAAINDDQLRQALRAFWGRCMEK